MFCARFGRREGYWNYANLTHVSIFRIAALPVNGALAARSPQTKPFSANSCSNKQSRCSELEASDRTPRPVATDLRFSDRGLALGKRVLLMYTGTYVCTCADEASKERSAPREKPRRERGSNPSVSALSLPLTAVAVLS
jgi:hypothetical protein